MDDVYLGLGSNLGDRGANLAAAVREIAALPCTELVESSPMYNTTPMGPQDQGDFLNMAVRLDTQLEPLVLIEKLNAIELTLGRAAQGRRRHWGPREIDIDILLFGARVIELPRLTIPHPGIAERWFVLRPLVDLTPGLMHPVLGRPVSELLKALEMTAATEPTT